MNDCVFVTIRFYASLLSVTFVLNDKIFGELLRRISAAANEDLADKPMPVCVGATGANVAIALAGWNAPGKYCTVLPATFMSIPI